MTSEIKQATIDFRVIALKLVALEINRSFEDLDTRAVQDNDETDKEVYGRTRSYEYSL